MTRFVIRRLIQSALLIFGIMTLSFVLIHLAPGGPLQLLAQDPRMSPAAIKRMEDQLGLNESIPIQYVKWLWGVIRLDFGFSFVEKRPVLNLITDAAVNSFWLSIGGTIIGLVGIPIGIYAAQHRESLAIMSCG